MWMVNVALLVLRLRCSIDPKPSKRTYKRVDVRERQDEQRREADIHPVFLLLREAAHVCVTAEVDEEADRQSDRALKANAFCIVMSIDCVFKRLCISHDCDLSKHVI